MEKSVAKLLPPEPVLSKSFRALARVCQAAARDGQLAGRNGNASLRLTPPFAELLVMTRSGAAKGSLEKKDICLILAKNGQAIFQGPASSEAPLHLALYNELPECHALLHTHPPRLLALSLLLEARTGSSGASCAGQKAVQDWSKDFLDLPLYEAGLRRLKLAILPRLEPGSADIAKAAQMAVQSLADKKEGALWLSGHGLCCFGSCLSDCLALAEELEHLATIQLALF